jgi:hypothetical protein
MPQSTSKTDVVDVNRELSLGIGFGGAGPDVSARALLGPRATEVCRGRAALRRGGRGRAIDWRAVCAGSAEPRAPEPARTAEREAGR